MTATAIAETAVAATGTGAGTAVGTTIEIGTGTDQGTTEIEGTATATTDEMIAETTAKKERPTTLSSRCLQIRVAARNVTTETDETATTTVIMTGEGTGQLAKMDSPSGRSRL